MSPDCPSPAPSAAASLQPCHFSDKVLPWDTHEGATLAPESHTPDHRHIQNHSLQCRGPRGGRYPCPGQEPCSPDIGSRTVLRDSAGGPCGPAGQRVPTHAQGLRPGLVLQRLVLDQDLQCRWGIGGRGGCLGHAMHCQGPSQEIRPTQLRGTGWLAPLCLARVAQPNAPALWGQQGGGRACLGAPQWPAGHRDLELGQNPSTWSHRVTEGRPC